MSQGERPAYCHPRAGLPMDPHPVWLLERAPAQRRISGSTCACGSAPEPASGSTCGTAVEKCCGLQQNRDCWGLTENLRCLRCANGRDPRDAKILAKEWHACRLPFPRSPGYHSEFSGPNSRLSTARCLCRGYLHAGGSPRGGGVHESPGLRIGDGKTCITSSIEVAIRPMPWCRRTRSMN